MNVLIIGTGKIAKALARICLSRGDGVSFFSSKDDRSQFQQRAAENDIVFLAIPTRDKGEIALAYILDTLQVGKPIVTCEKGSSAYHFDKIKPHFGRIGFMATVGGASDMLGLFAFPHFGLGKITGIVNGTTNFLFSECGQGKDPYDVLAEAQSLELCEPGNDSLAGVVNAEIDDMCLKAVPLFLHSGISEEPFRADEFGKVYLSEGEILHELRRNRGRFVVSIGRKRDPAIRDRIYRALYVQKGGWHIQVGLADMNRLPFLPFPKLQENTLVTEDMTGSTQITGIGAGSKATAATMVLNGDGVLARR